jgi:hypothetical protein
MRHAIAAALFMAATAVSAAQTSSTVQTPPQTAPAKPVTVIGCLGSSPDQKSFTLTTSEPAAKAGPVGTSGTMESGAPAMAKPDAMTTIYTVEPIATIDLSKHVGHTVEVTGVEPPAESSAASQVPATSATPQIAIKRLTASAVKQVSNDCRVRGDQK